MMHPELALRMQADLLSETNTQEWERFIVEFAGAFADINQFIYRGDTERIARQGSAMLSGMKVALRMAETFVVDARMNPLIRQAAIDWPTDMKLQPYMLPSESGFMIFERAWDNPGHGSSGKNEKIKAVLWRVYNGRIALYEFVSWSEPSEDMLDFMNQLADKSGNAEAARRIVRSRGDIDLVHLSMVKMGASLPEMLSGEALDGHDDFGLISSRPYNRASLPLAAVFATWALMRQTLVNVNPHRMTPKRFAGFQRKRIPGKVSVITLRQRSAEPVHPGESGRKIGVQFVVRGHWRRVHYGPRGNQTTEWVYIHPHFRGPEDGPLKDSAKVNVLRR